MWCYGASKNQAEGGPVTLTWSPEHLALAVATEEMRRSGAGFVFMLGNFFFPCPGGIKLVTTFGGPNTSNFGLSLGSTPDGEYPHQTFAKDPRGSTGHFFPNPNPVAHTHFQRPQPTHHSPPPGRRSHTGVK